MGPLSEGDFFPLSSSSCCNLNIKYIPLWNEYLDEKQLVWAVWTQHVKGSPVYIWETKLKKTKQALKDWAKNHYKEPEKFKKEVKAKLQEVHNNIEKQEPTQDHLK